jgi:hypothetical protein
MNRTHVNRLYAQYSLNKLVNRKFYSFKFKMSYKLIGVWGTIHNKNQLQFIKTNLPCLNYFRRTSHFSTPNDQMLTSPITPYLFSL